MSGRYIPLLWRLFVPNAVVLIAACIVLWRQPANGRVLALGGGLAVLLVVNVVLMRRSFTPLVELTDAMRRTDPLEPGRRIGVHAAASEVTVLTESFNDMLDRIERERRESGRRALAAEEAERRRLAAELHDEIGQNLTALGMQLSHVAKTIENGAADDVRVAHDLTLETVEAVRRLSRELRPEALDDLGLVAALATLCERIAARTEVRIQSDLRTDLPELAPEAELVIYRAAQESLTNVMRHAGASRAAVSLRAGDGTVTLEVLDDGVGAPDGAGDGAGGLRFMRERALAFGAHVRVEPAPGGGTRVVLTVPPST
jgi:two-component system sensor histidine kinase UhpB